MKKIICAILTGGILAGSMILSCGAEDITKITVLRPGDQEKVEAFLEPAVEQFEAENPDIDVVTVYESWAGWIQKYPTSFEAGTQPDVVFWWDNKLNDSSARDCLVNLEEYLEEDFFAQIPESV